MKWKSDWLHRLISLQIESLWRQITREGNGEFGPAPDVLVICQHSDIESRPYEDATKNSLIASFVGPRVRQWRFDGAEFREEAENEVNPRKRSEIRGMFYRTGRVDFAISPDRKLVLVQFVVGPRYGRHMVFEVVGQGRTGKLQPKPGFLGWIS